MLLKRVVFRFESELPPEAKVLLEDFRMAGNNAIRAAIESRVTSRNALNRLAYKGFRQDFPGMYAKHLVSVFEVAASVLKNHRRRLRRQIDVRVPYVRRLMMKAENQAYKLARQSGVIDLPIRAGCHVTLNMLM